ncbi:MAG: sulfurtransferase [Spirochaetae bacterium HGW-Spirochaetae-1]|jgi:hypothetical protein|nr:MAG: sulfurtransferase [Spirochaetae bacterium HGW-Spirochaetae-1]
MFAPLAVFGNWSNGINFVFAFVIGIGFGFALESGGFGNSRKLAWQFYFKDLTVFKVMFTAIITAMAGIIFLDAFGWLDVNSMLINPTYLWSGIAGGVIMGFGFAIGGYCPGTSFAGLATLKVDAVFYLAGIFLGMFVFGEIAPSIDAFYSGKYSGFMGTVTIYEYLGVSAGVVGFVVVLIALGGFFGAEWVEKKYGEIVE